MNRDQLLDAIGMVDEQKIRDALMVKRTKRMTGVLTALVIAAVVLFMVAIGYGIALFCGSTVSYPTDLLARDIDSARVVTVLPDPSDRLSSYAIYVPDGTSDAMRFDEWEPADQRVADDREKQLVLRFHATEVTFYEGGVARAEKHDWDDYVGVYTVPADLWRELSAMLAEEYV